MPGLYPSRKQEILPHGIHLLISLFSRASCLPSAQKNRWSKHKYKNQGSPLPELVITVLFIKFLQRRVKVLLAFHCFLGSNPREVWLGRVERSPNLTFCLSLLWGVGSIINLLLKCGSEHKYKTPGLATPCINKKSVLLRIFLQAR
jgi:hypothetical protein